MSHRLIVRAAGALLCLTTVAIPASRLAAAEVAKPEKPAKPLHVSRGNPVKLTDYLVPGKTVVFDFYSDYCGPCVQMAPALDQLHRTNPNVVVVKVDINRPNVKGIDWRSPVAEQYKLRSIPHFKVYGPDGKLAAEDGTGGSKAREMVQALMAGRK